MSFQDDSQPSQDSVMTLTDEDRHEVLYFAYGSNMSTTQMLHRCPFSTPIGLGHLPGWRWFINARGFANIAPEEYRRRQEDKVDGEKEEKEQEEKEQGEKGYHGVWGVLYLLPPRDEVLLDGYEGVPHAYQKVQMDVRLVQASSSQGQDGTGAAAAPGGVSVFGQENAAASAGVRASWETVRALVYVDQQRTAEGGAPRDEYVGRMERAVEEAMGEWGLDEGYVDGVVRRSWKGKGSV